MSAERAFHDEGRPGKPGRLQRSEAEEETAGVSFSSGFLGEGWWHARSRGELCYRAPPNRKARKEERKERKA